MGETLKERKRKEAEQEAMILGVLEGRKKALAVAKREKRHKKKSVGELLLMLVYRDLLRYALQSAETYVPRSHNLNRQLIGLINHLFVQYPVPHFMYQTCLSDTARCQERGRLTDFGRAQETYRFWFVTLAQGQSFPKAVKGIMTSKEAYAFLRAPLGKQIHENVWWAKMMVAGIPNRLIDTLIDRVFTDYFHDDSDGRLTETILFYAHQHHALDKNSFNEVTDFIAHNLRYDTGFRLKGRTAASVIKLSNEWHLLMQRAKLGQQIQWSGLGIADWIYTDNSEVFEVTELRNNQELVNEGRKQKHCVYSYVHWCVAGRSAIFSLRVYRNFALHYDADGKPLLDRSFETRRVTIEVSHTRSVIQIRGPLNRAPSSEEKGILRRWAGEKGFVL